MTKMTQEFLDAWAATGRAEGGYSNNPNDAGGETMWGITERVARAHGYEGSMRDLPKELAQEIAKAQYWDLMFLDDVAAVSLSVARELFDTGFNAGLSTAVKFLQRTLNALNRQQKDYDDLKADGLMGPLSIVALSAFLIKRKTEGEKVLLRALNGLQAAYFIAIAEVRPQNEDFVFGWLLQRVVIGEV